MDTLQLELALADALRFVPVDFREDYSTVLQTDIGEPLALQPSASSVTAAESAICGIACILSPGQARKRSAGR